MKNEHLWRRFAGILGGQLVRFFRWTFGLSGPEPEPQPEPEPERVCDRCSKGPLTPVPGTDGWLVCPSGHYTTGE